MNRSLTNVLFGGISAPQQAQKQIEGKITTATVDDVSEALTNAENVVIVCSNPSSFKSSTNPHRLSDTAWQ